MERYSYPVRGEMKHRIPSENSSQTMSRSPIPPFEFAPYQYERLPAPTSLRLLSLIPAEFNKSQATICGQPILSCLMETVDLEHMPIYSVLSCTPDNPRVKPDDRYNVEQKWPISVNGRLLYVTKNVHEALKHMQRSVAEQNEVDLKREPYQKTLLIEAAEKGHADEIKQLIARGASLDMQDRFGETALHYAAENGHLEAVKVLLQNGANKSILDSSKRTPVSCCIQRKRGQWVDVQRALTYHRPTASTGFKELPRLSQIWVEAVCVDQANIAELNAQKMMMSQIYSYASKMTVWLGVADHETSRAADILARVADHNDWLGLEDGEREVLCNIVRKHKWFQKEWAYQEIACAKWVEMESGDYVFDWETLSNVLPRKELEHLRGSEPPSYVPARQFEKGRGNPNQWGA